MMEKPPKTLRATALAALQAVALGAALASPALAADKIAVLVKSLGIRFFDAVHQGAQEAAKELSNIEIIYTGPAKPTAEGQIEIINALISQKVAAIVISANDPDALAPSLKRAMGRGIKVLSFDSGVRKDGRMMHLSAANDALIGEKLVQLTQQAIGDSGEIAIVSSTAQATNQNIWIEEIRKVLARPAYKGLKLVSVVYGDEQIDKSYRETQGLFKSYPNLKAIIAPVSMAVPAAAKAVQDEKKIGSVYVTGLGLPSEMAGHVKSGAVKSFAIWNPIDLGYSSIQAASQLIAGKFTGKPGDKVSLGRVGSVVLDANSEAAMAEPFTYDASNVEKFAKIF
ncbi:rhamnose ABC transporter substrate-binding protein [Verminephrobacter eiseniae]|nr:rhamnose ABC transporter substrate-binding protein [Verminephrobacter eiseniae]MCW5301182.1 rhamnose ABC transporter substrate-binding protein [Verminephrobacter eiseniae]MCW8180178.1 rhamnose ABC transporter substrate-binding protein [Verminephrobacter eiseniae]MCW8189210.1 rhamnose ABC transporter substrate-binding protein [Verminephrobacter eiseniae]